MKKFILAVSLAVASLAALAGSTVNAESVKGATSIIWTSISKSDIHTIVSDNTGVRVTINVQGKDIQNNAPYSGIWVTGCDNNPAARFVSAGTIVCQVGGQGPDMNMIHGKLQWASQENGVKLAQGTYSVK